MTALALGCSLCDSPGVAVVVNNVLDDDDTIEVCGGPVRLDPGEESSLGSLLCDAHSVHAVELGYTVEPLGDRAAVDRAVAAYVKNPTPGRQAKVEAAAEAAMDAWFAGQAEQMAASITADGVS